MDKQQAIQLLSTLDKTTGILPAELMPKTTEQALSVLENWPMLYYKALHPKTVNDVFQSPSCSIAVMNKNFGETKLRAFMAKIIIYVVMFFNVGKIMNDNQAAQTADLIIEEYYFLKPDDFKLCFTRAKKGYYGKVFDRIDGQVIFEWLNQYTNDRMTTASDTSIQEAERFKDLPGERTSSLLEQADHDFKKYDFERKHKVE